MKDIKNRAARFRTVIALLINNKRFLFQGKINGSILNQVGGTKGFGYDPVFCPNGYDKSFAQMDTVEKNQISHRGMAIKQLVKFLLKNKVQPFDIHNKNRILNENQTNP